MPSGPQDGFSFQTVDGDADLTIIALHGSGADEGTMLPLASSVASDATVIALRGRIDQEGERRWFCKLSPTSFDQTSIHDESCAFANFLTRLFERGDASPEHCIFLGYSNGGNLLHATMLMHPGLIMRAALLRCMPVLARAPRTDISGSSVLLVRGADDATYGPFAPALARLLRSRGAKVSTRTVDGGHLFGPRDALIVSAWLRQFGLPASQPRV